MAIVQPDVSVVKTECYHNDLWREITFTKITSEQITNTKQCE